MNDLNLPEYGWWGQPNEPPPHLKTKTQLSRMGLAPLKAVGFIATTRCDMLLYDSINSESCKSRRKPTQKELDALVVKREKSLISRRLKKAKDSQNSC
jgi:hypothetical protein